MNSLFKNKPGLSDVCRSLQGFSLAVYLGWLDVKQRYRRSKVGPFWITISMAVTIGTIGLVFSKVFKTNIKEYLPYLSVGIILWNYVLSSVSDSCNAFVDFRAVILERPLPLFFHIIRILTKNTIILMHNIVIVPVLLIILGYPVGNVILLVPLGLLFLVLTLSWVSLLFAIVCTRFRDFPQIINSIMQVLFYATPVIWTPSQIPGRYSSLILKFNPLYSYIEIIRSPILGHGTSLADWLVAILIAVGGWLLCIFIFNKYRNRIPYWV